MSTYPPSHLAVLLSLPRYLVYLTPLPLLWIVNDYRAWLAYG